MGGGSYSRSVYSSSSSWSGSSSSGSSSTASRRMSSSSLHSSMKPKGKIITSNSKNPIIIALDVTGSNIELARIVYDKMPMLHGQIEQQGYLDDFDICFMAVGDAYTDDYPLQVTDFAKGIALDSWLEKVVLEGNGGGNGGESYNLAAEYLNQNFKFAPDATPRVFFIADEPIHKTIEHEHFRDYIGSGERSSDAQMSKKAVFERLNRKVDDSVFCLNPSNRGYESSIDDWKKAIPSQNVIKIKDAKEIVDLILGTIALTSQSRDIAAYQVDMKNRGQTAQRIASVAGALQNLNDSLALTVVDDKLRGMSQLNGAKKTQNKSSLL